MRKLLTKITAVLLLVATLCSLSSNPAFAATSRYNVSYSPVTCNASSGSLPSSVTTVYTGDKIYFNFQVDSSQKLKSVELYYMAPGSSSYSKKTETATNYLRYAYFAYTVGNTAGTLKYYFKVTNTSGKTTTYSTQSITVKKLPISTNYSGTSSTTSSSNYVTVNGTKIKAGDIFYTYYKSGSSYVKSTGGSAYYVKIGSSYVYVAAAQCMGFAHYVQYLLYGKYDGTTSTLNSGFTQIAKNVTTTSANAKTYITKAGAGAHIRTSGSYTHSLIVVSVNSNGFYYVDANGTGTANQIRIGYMTWSAFASKYTKIAYIRYKS